MSLTVMSGSRANIPETHTPIVSPTITDNQSTDIETSRGRKSPSTRGSVDWTPRPSSTPAVAPANPSAIA